VTTAVHFVRASKTEIELGAREQELSAEAANALKITARVDPPVTGAPIALDVTDSQQRSIAILPARTAADGSATWVLGEFIARDLMPALRQGEKYSFQADFYGTANLESSSSPPVTISVR
jgi:hypothetical protein